MLRLPISAMFLILLLTCFCLSSVSVRPVKSLSITIIVPNDYPTIQGAINNANNGDLIFVRSGVYPEEITVNKTVSLIGQDKETTIIDASGKVSGITITFDNVTLSGFTVQNSGWNGILVQSSYCFLSNNTLIESNEEGIFLDGRTAHVFGNTITDNLVLKSGDCGILVWAATNNYIDFNTVEEAFFGIFLYLDATCNQIGQNIISNNSDAGVVLDICGPNNRVVSNNITNNGRIVFTIWNAGIALNVCSENQIVSNYISNNQKGILQNTQTNNNLIYHNSFVDNKIQVDNPTLSNDIWDDGYPDGGNYWSDYAGLDEKRGPYQNLTGTDGIGDTPYAIDGNDMDHYPLMRPYMYVLGDLNRDSKVDIRDIVIVASAFGSFPDHPRWNPEADINQDEIIDIRDIAIVASNFGKLF